MIRRIVILLLVAFLTFEIYGQSTIVRIDSLPEEGFLLNKGWKFRADDNPDFANPDFDDSKWESIDPTRDVMELKQVREVPVSWLRIRVMLNDSTFYQKPALVVKQTGATEFYLNGKLLYRFGKIDPGRTATKGYDPLGQAIALPLEMNKENVLAVRFAFPSIFLTREYYLPNPCLKIAVSPIEYITATAGHLNILPLHSRLSGMFKSGMLLLIAVLHLWFFWALPKQKANLFFSLYAFMTSLIMFGETIANLYIHDLYIRNVVHIFCMVSHPLSTLFPFVAVYMLFNAYRNTYFWITVLVTVISIPLMLRPYFTGYLFGIFVPMLLACIGVFTLAWKEAKKGNKAASGLYFSVVLIFIAYAAYFWGVSFIEQKWLKAMWSEVTFDITVLSLPAALSYYLAVDFAQNKNQIEQNFMDFQRLAAEKESLLLQQNAELQAALLEGQTTERQRLAADLHDNLGSTLSALHWSMEAINPQKLSPQEQQVYRHVQAAIAQAHDQVRLLSHNLLPDELQKQGLRKALQHLTDKLNRNTPLRWSLTLPDNPPGFDPKTEFELYSIVLELTNNILKHAHATEGKVEFRVLNGECQMTVSDNGVGMSDKRENGKGMQSVESRVKSLNGTLSVSSQVGEGTRFEVTVGV